MLYNQLWCFEIQSHTQYFYQWCTCILLLREGW